VCPGPALWGMDTPSSLAKASDRRVRADKGLVGHGLKGSINRDDEPDREC